jgi:deazaflavin-dependent oxidoreductase (nitroreductase family)
VAIDTAADWTEEQHASRGVARLNRAIVRAISRRDGGWPLRRFMVASDRLLYRISRGKWSMSATSRMPSLMLLVTRPAGGVVAVPLQYLIIEDEMFIIGTNWCRPKHPLWSKWLLKYPECRINVKGREEDRRATLITGAERAALWPKIVHKSAYFDECERRTGRQPRVYRLEAI